MKGSFQLRHAIVAVVLLGVTGLCPVHANTITNNFATDPGWSGSGNTANGHSYGFSNTGTATGSAGEVGGTFARSAPESRYGDTSINPALTLANAFSVSGTFWLGNVNGWSAAGDSEAFIGFYDAAVSDGHYSFLGVQLRESGTSGDTTTFRAQARFQEPNGGGSDTSLVNYNANTPHTFMISYDPALGATGRVSIVIDNGTPNTFDLSVGERSDGATFDAFGIGTSSVSGTGHKNSETDTNKTVQIFLDNVICSIASSSGGGGSPTNVLHVASMQLVAPPVANAFQPTATVQIIDALGNPVRNAFVTYVWSGLVSGTSTVLTDDNGTINPVANQVTGPGTITFQVTNVSKAGCTYDSNQNALTQISLNVVARNSLHVDSIQLITEPIYIGYRPIATVRITDAAGDPIPNAFVTYIWSGLVSGTSTVQTGADGTASPVTSLVTGAGTVTFQIIDVSKAGYIYDPNQNVIAQVSINAPIGPFVITSLTSNATYSGAINFAVNLGALATGDVASVEYRLNGHGAYMYWDGNRILRPITSGGSFSTNWATGNLFVQNSRVFFDAVARDASGNVLGTTPAIPIRIANDNYNLWDPLESTCRHASLSIL